MINDGLKSQYKQAGNDLGDKLVQVTNTHLTTQGKMLEELLSKSNLTHLPQASPIARRLLIDHFGKHLPKHIIDLLGEVETLVGVSASVDDCIAATTIPPNLENVQTGPSPDRGEQIIIPTNEFLKTPRPAANIPIFNRFQILETINMDQGETSSKKKRVHSGTPPKTLGNLIFTPKRKRIEGKGPKRTLPLPRLDLSPEIPVVDRPLPKQSISSSLDGTRFPIPTNVPRPNPSPTVSPDSDPNPDLDPIPNLEVNPNPNLNPNPDPISNPDPNSNPVPNSNQDPTPNLELNPNLNFNPNPDSKSNPDPNSNPVPNSNQDPSPNPNLDPNPNLNHSPNPAPNLNPDPNSNPGPNPNPNPYLNRVGSRLEIKLTRVSCPGSIEHCETASTSTHPGPIQPLVERTGAWKSPRDEMRIITLSDDDSHSDSEELLTIRHRRVLENQSTGREGVLQTGSSRLMSKRPGPGYFLERKNKKDPLEIFGETEVLLVGDSNLRLFTPPPGGWQVACIPGLNLAQLATILKSTVKPPNLKHIIVSAGINDRDSSDTSSLVECLKVGRSPFRTIHFQSIVFSRDLDLRQTNNLTRLNKVARDLDFVRTISSHSIKPKFKDQFQIHYDKNTAMQIFENMISHITSLNSN